MSTFDEKDWSVLVNKIKSDMCTIFIGAGACQGYIPLGVNIANELIDDLKVQSNISYPFDNPNDLMRVAQFYSAKMADADHVKLKVSDIIRKEQKVTKVKQGAPNAPHNIMANFKLPIYITTNYDDLMYQALDRTIGTSPNRLTCSWRITGQNQALTNQVRRSRPQPTSNSPIVFHLHGYHLDTDSMVLNEDDYIDFLVNLGKDNFTSNSPIIPHYVQSALTKNTLLFVGYGLKDWNFKVIFRALLKLVDSKQIRHITVQMEPSDASKGMETDAKEYLDTYFDKLPGQNRATIGVYWGKASGFLMELRDRLNASGGKP